MAKRKPLAITDADGHSWTRALHLSDRHSVLDGVMRTRDGYLKADAKVARVGTQVYRGYEVGLPDKDRVVLYRPPEEVFAKDSMHSHANKPVTLTHPKEMVDAKSWAKVAKGISGGEVVRDGDFVRVPLMLTDADTISAYERGEARELSVGYTCDIDWTAGVTPDGKAFDGVQREIRTNHHALVPVARGGASLRLGDAGRTCPECGAAVADDATKCQDCGAQLDDDEDGDMYDGILPRDRQSSAARGGNPPRRETIMPFTKMFDGIPVNFVDEQSAAIIDKEVRRLHKVIDEQTAAMKKKNDDDEDDKKQMDAKDAAIKEKEGQIAMLQKQLKDAAVTDEQIDAKIVERSAILDAAKPHLPQGYDAKGKTLDDIRRAAVGLQLGDATVKDWDAAMIRGAFETLTRTKVATGARAMADGLSRGFSQVTTMSASVVDAESAYAEMVKSRQEAWKTPIRSN